MIKDNIIYALNFRVVADGEVFFRVHPLKNVQPSPTVIIPMGKSEVKHRLPLNSLLYFP